MFALVLSLICCLASCLCQSNVPISPELQTRMEELAGLGQYGKAFDLFQEIFNKSYSEVSEAVRRQDIFRRNYDFILEQNALYANKSITYKLGMNWFGDLTSAEILDKYTGYENVNASEKIRSRAAVEYYNPQGNIPRSLDLRKYGVVAPVISQLSCSACWAFCAAAALETTAALKNGKLVQLSPQSLLDCSSASPNGCIGGSMRQAFNYAQVNGGVASLASYPFIAEQQTCRNEAVVSGTGITSYSVIRNENDIADALANQGAVSVAVNASPESFAYYTGGIYQNSMCDSSVINHGLAVIGYGTENGQDYWIMKNSWGVNWGLQGYIKIARGKNMCGLTADMTIPNVVKTTKRCVKQ